jgi:predicted phage terminase large subunit-like protein
LVWSGSDIPLRPEIATREVATRTVRSVKKVGWEDAVFNVRVGPHHNYFASGFLVHNCDDLHSVKSSESDAVRSETVRWVREGMSNRLNDMAKDVIIGIGQRVHEEDASAAMLNDGDYVHLNIPMLYDSSRHCKTAIGWEDPRTEDGELAWPERFPLSVVNKLKTTLGPYAFSAQYQQAPSPRGGGIIKREWWQLWDEPTYPKCYYRWASADTAYTEKESNDPTGFTCWGLFEIQGQPNIILMDAWRKRLELHIPSRWVEDSTPDYRKKQVDAWAKAAWAQKRRAEKEGRDHQEPLISAIAEPWASFIATGHNNADRWPNETYDDWRMRTQSKWGLCEWLAHSCRRFSVNELIIEGKASGISVAQELRRLNGNEGWGIKTVTPEGDKVARAYAVQSIFSAGLVHAPEREWSEMVIDEVSSFPKGRYKDLTDSTSMALKHIREIGLLVRPEERVLHEELAARHVPSNKPLY